MIDIADSKIKIAKWYLRSKKTKKFVCEYIGIPYNTKKLDQLIADHDEREERTARLKAEAKTKELSAATIKDIVASYIKGEAQSKIAERYYITSARVKSILLSNNVPIRSRKKNAPAKVDHIRQNLDDQLKINDKVYYSALSCNAVIADVHDENKLEYLKSGRQRYVETYAFNEKTSKHLEPVEGIHYEIYWQLPDKKEIKLRSLKSIISRIETILECTGRESYDIWVEGDDAHYKMYVPRAEIIKLAG